MWFNVTKIMHDELILFRYECKIKNISIIEKIKCFWKAKIFIVIGNFEIDGLIFVYIEEKNIQNWLSFWQHYWLLLLNSNQAASRMHKHIYWNRFKLFDRLKNYAHKIRDKIFGEIIHI